MVGTKLAPPHTRLQMNTSHIMVDILNVIADSSHPALGIHIGTTPFCGPFGDLILGQKGLCTPEYVDPFFMLSYVVAYPDVTFVLMHGGQDFAGPDDPFVPFYNGTNFDYSVDLASKYDNVYIEISAMLDRNEEEGYAYENPLALENLRKLVEGVSKIKFSTVETPMPFPDDSWDI
jgi:predicted TIM-barrel fold metal-dependent hydrolase